MSASRAAGTRLDSADRRCVRRRPVLERRHRRHRPRIRRRLQRDHRKRIRRRASNTSTARFEQEQHGRLVLGGLSADEQVPHTTRLHDSLLSVARRYVDRVRGRPACSSSAGLGARLGLADDRRRSERASKTNDDRVDLRALTGGVDVHAAVDRRAPQLVFGGRYTFNDRADNQPQYLGIGPHVIARRRRRSNPAELDHEAAAPADWRPLRRELVVPARLGGGAAADPRRRCTHPPATATPSAAPTSRNSPMPAISRSQTMRPTRA